MSKEHLQVVTGTEFAKASAKLPKEIRAKLSKATSSLFNDVGSFGAHQEKIQAADDDIYSLRVDDDYRIIMKQPNGGNVVFLLYVDKHDDAYAWAKKHCTRINASTGGIQTSVAMAPNIVRDNGRARPNAKLSALTDDNMRTLGIPPKYWEQLRTQIFTPNHLMGYKKILSYEAYSTLEEMMNGLPVDEAMVLFSEISQSIEVEDLTPEDNIPGLFATISDEDLLSLGVPSQQLNLVRSVKLEKELINLASVLPEDAMQSLYALRDGESVDAIKKLTYTDSTPVDNDDYTAALKNPITKSQFASIEDEEAMKALLEYPAAQWRAYLHPSQRRLIERHYGGPARIIGGAGTGKTVVIVHRARYLTQFCGDDEKVLVTSFNKSLVADIEERLSTICSSKELQKIEVITVDKKTYEITKKLGYSIKYDRDIKPVWEYAIRVSGIGSKFTLEFIMDEWIHVIQAQQIKTKETYYKAQRTGRSKRLDQASREQLWKVFEIYQTRCKEQKIMDTDWAQNMCAESCLGKKLYRYYSILVDECQDLRAPAYRMLRALAGDQRQDDIFFSGDARQRIYKGRASLSQCGIMINNRSNTLKLNYRTTAEIYDAAMKIQQEYQYDDLDGKTVEHDLCTCIFHGERPTINGYTYENAEWNSLVEDIQKKIKSGIPSQEICILVKTNRLVGECANRLMAKGIQCLQLSNQQNDDLSISGIRLATMHRVKGMEYACVYIPFMTSDYMPSRRELVNAEDEDAKQEILLEEANLLSVAMTRAKRYVWLSYSGTPSQYIEKLRA